MHGFVTEPTQHSLDGKEKRNKKGNETPLKECPECSAICPIMIMQCPECGHEFPKSETVYTHEDLIELTAENIHDGKPRAHAVPLEERQKAFNQIASEIVRRGFKYNAAFVRYQNIYGERPDKNSGIKYPRFFWQYVQKQKKAMKAKYESQKAKR